MLIVAVSQLSVRFVKLSAKRRCLLVKFRLHRIFPTASKGVTNKPDFLYLIKV